MSDPLHDRDAASAAPVDVEPDASPATEGLTAAEAVPATPAEFDERAAADAAARLAAEEAARAREAAEAARAAAIAEALPPTKDDLAALAAAAEAARPLPRTVPAMEPTAADVEAAAMSATAARRRVAPRRVARRLASVVVVVALLAVGVAIGNSLYVSTQPPAPAVGDPATEDVETPTAVTEFIGALASTDADALRSALQPPVYDLLAGELRSLGMQQVNEVETLATMRDGDETATEIIMKGVGMDGEPIVWNLIVHVVNNQIVSFR